MFEHIPSFESLVFEMSKFPGIGPKTAQRLAYHVLKSPEDFAQNLSIALTEMRERVQLCNSCFSYTEQEICKLCSDHDRDDHILCIVENPSEIAQIEASGAFRGRYHVLHGVISPLDGIGPENLKITELYKKIESSDISEIILALDADLEGDTTVLYLSKYFSEKGLKVTRIAHGVPIGGDIDYIDHRTLGRAIQNRIEV